MDVEYRSELEQVRLRLEGQQPYSKDTGIQEEEDSLKTVDDILSFYSNKH